MSIKIHANRVLGTIHVTKFLGVFKKAQIKPGPRAPTNLNAALQGVLGRVIVNHFSQGQILKFCLRNQGMYWIDFLVT